MSQVGTSSTHKPTRSVRVAVDAMGGDFAPVEIIRGAVEAAQQDNVEVILVGPEARLRAELAAADMAGLPLAVHHTEQFIADGESPASALRAKPEASVLVCTRLVKEGQADAAVSMGHTGASMIAAHWTFGALPGVQRPVAGGVLFPLAPQTAVFDLGANAGCKPEQFLQFAAVGVAYARCLLGVANPTVGLLSNGSEPSKGTAQTRAAYNLLAASNLNFIGYVEGWDLTSGRANVVVCDGFVGNIVIKYGEGLGRALADWLTERLEGHLPSSEIQTIADDLLEMMEVERRLGGGPLLGVDGVMVVGHGRSRAPAVRRAIVQARQAVEQGLVEALRAELASVEGLLQGPHTAAQDAAHKAW